MRLITSVIIGICCSNFAIADPNIALQPITDLSEFSRNKSANQIQWNNQRPEQQRALNQFYQSMGQATSNPQTSQRERQVQQMRNMNAQQRQQLFLNYIKQNR